MTTVALARLRVRARHAWAAGLPRLRRSRRGLWLTAGGAGALAGLLALLGALPGAPSPGTPAPAIPRRARALDEAATEAAAPTAERASASTAGWPAGAASPAEAGGWGRRIVRHATFEVEPADVGAALARLTELVEAAGGYVADTQVQSDDAGIARATVTAYVPPAAFGRALADVERLGRVARRRLTGQDVSEEFVDLEARLRNLERHEAQLLAFMGRAQKVADLVSLEGELARVRGEAERLTGRLRFLRARTEMAGLAVTLRRAEGPLPAGSDLARARERVRLAFLAGWTAAFELAVGAAAAAARVTPLAVAALLGWVLYRRLRRPAVAPPSAIAS